MIWVLGLQQQESGKPARQADTCRRVIQQ